MEEKIWTYIVNTFLGGKTQLSHQEFSFANKPLDSLSHVKLIFFLEKEFGVAFSMDDMSKEKFQTVEQIATIVRKMQADK